MAHTEKEVQFLVDTAIELGVFKSLTHDCKQDGPNQEKCLQLSEELKKRNINSDDVFRVVSILPNGEDNVYYTSKEVLMEILSEDENGFDIVWKAVKTECEKTIDAEQECSVVGDIEHEDYE